MFLSLGAGENTYRKELLQTAGVNGQVPTLWGGNHTSTLWLVIAQVSVGSIQDIPWESLSLGIKCVLVVT